MSLIQTQDLALEFGGTYVLDGISCAIEHNSRIGLIGPNGCGKSTLIKLMLGQLTPTSGTVQRASRCVVAYLPQNAMPDQDLSLLDYVLGSRPDIAVLKAEIEALSARLNQAHTPETEAALASAVERFTSLGGYEWDNELKYVLSSLSFPESEWGKRIALFSGGEQTRICLAKFLLMPHDLLILDEPTNHLDLSMTAWLERYLNKQPRPYLLVSHDRHFLDNTVSTIFSLRDGRLSVTKGNYSSFKEADAIARLSARRMYDRQQKYISETMDFIRKNMAGQKTNQAKSRLKQLNRLEKVARPEAQHKLKIRVNAAHRSGNDVYSLDDVSFGVPGKELVREATIRAGYRDRVCLIGPNGCGKTTLLRILMGEHDITDGILKTGASLRIAYFDQHQVSLDDSLTVMDTLWQLVPQAPRGYVLSWLARFGFRGDDVDKHVSILSGGEKSRLQLSVLIHSDPNLLIMDEPTNHLDMDMADSLLEALQSFPGTIIFVSHDRYFLSQLANRFWVFRRVLGAAGLYATITEMEQDADAAIELSFAIPEAPKEAPPLRERRKRINPLILERKQDDIHAARADVEDLLARLEDVHRMLSDSGTYAEPSRLKDLKDREALLQQQIAAGNEAVSILEDEYLELLCDE